MIRVSKGGMTTQAMRMKNRTKEKREKGHGRQVTQGVRVVCLPGSYSYASGLARAAACKGARGGVSPRAFTAVHNSWLGCPSQQGSVVAGVISLVITLH